VPTALNGESDWPVELRHLVRPQPLGLSLPQPDPRDRLAVLNLVVHRRGIAAHLDHGRQSIQPLASRPIHQLCGVQRQPGSLEAVPGIHLAELGEQEGSH
jgi:hypothetical protein